MANTVYAKGKEALLSGDIDIPVDTIMVGLFRASAYTPNTASDQYLSTAGTPVATATLASKTVTSGVFDAADATFTAVAAGAAIDYAVIYKDTGSAATSPLLYIIDGKFGIVCAAAASSSATSITVDPLLQPLANGSTVVFGAVTATLTAGASAGARTLTVSALSGGISQGTAGVPSAQGGLPVTPNGGDLTLAFDSGASKIFSL